MTSYIVDMQGFQAPGGEFVFKEVDIAPLKQKLTLTQVFCFLPPHRLEFLPIMYQTTNKWIELKHHGIPWKAGSLPYSSLRRVLLMKLANCEKVYVKGAAKVAWLKAQLPHEISVADVEELGCPSLSKLPVDDSVFCPNHHVCRDTSFTCAMRNVIKLLGWMEEKEQQADLMKQMNRCQCDCPKHRG